MQTRQVVKGDGQHGGHADREGDLATHEGQDTSLLDEVGGGNTECY